MSWQHVGGVGYDHMTKRQLLEKLQSLSGRGPSQTAAWRTPKIHRGGTDHPRGSGSRTQAGDGAQNARSPKANPAWYCAACGTHHDNPKTRKCRHCSLQRAGHSPPAGKPRPIDSAGVQSVFTQLQMIEDGEAAQQRDQMETTEAGDIRNLGCPEQERLERMLEDAVSLKLGEATIAEVKCRITKMEAAAQALAPKVALETSITLRTALKNTRELHEKANKSDDKAVETAEEGAKKAQEHLTAAQAKRDERVKTFKQEETKLLEALKKAETGPTPGQGTLHQPPGQGTAGLTETALLDMITAFASTEEGRAALAVRGLATTQTAHNQQHPAEVDFQLTQDGAQEPNEQDIENLVRKLPKQFHAKLAHRLAQPGVQLAAPETAGTPSRPDAKAAAARRGRPSESGETAEERRGRLGSRSRTP